MTPVMLLTDGYIANAAEPWAVPDMADYAPFPVKFHDELPAEGEPLLPYARDEKLARPWIKPGTPGLMHRIGGRSEEHTSELQSLMRISYAVFCLKKKTKKHIRINAALQNTT